MIIFELTNTEAHPVYRALEVANGNRQYDFLRSIITASLDIGRPFLSQHVVKALNFQAITCLHILQASTVRRKLRWATIIRQLTIAFQL